MHQLRHRKRAFRRVAGPFAYTEGPVSDGERVLFTDVPSHRIIEYRPLLNRWSVERADTGGANGLALDRAGRVHACQGSTRRVVRYESDGGVTVLADRYDGGRLNSPNDLVVDSKGSIWFTDPRYGRDRDDLELDHESVYRVDFSGGGVTEISRVAYDTVRPNGLALARDERTLYVADSPTAPAGERYLLAYPVKMDRTLGPPTVLMQFGRSRGVDGLCVHPDGRILVTCGWRRSGPGSRIAVLGPDGWLLDEYPTPFEPTNICLAGEEATDVFVTGKDGGLWTLRLAD